jgi:hypothetical protein
LILVCFSGRVLCFVTQDGLKPWSSCLCLLSSWVYSCVPLHLVPKLFNFFNTKDYSLQPVDHEITHL